LSQFTVLGAGGFVGGHLAERLRRNGHDVVAVSRRDRVAYDRTLGHVVFCIGLTTDYWKRPLDTAEAHVCALIPLLRADRFDSLTYLSSIRLYDGLEDAASETSDLRLNPQTARHVYDFSKGLGEALTHNVGRRARVVRLGNVYDNELDQDDFLCRTVQRAVREDALEVDADPEAGRDYVHVDDVCAAIEAIGLSGRESTYNVASGIVFTNSELAALCERELNCRVTFRGAASAHRSPRVDVTRLSREFKIDPVSPSGRLPGILKAIAAR